MSSTIKVDNIQNQCGANIINESSNTITIGASGDTVSLASGASQSGFGRTGTVDWDTTPKTASFTATNGDGFFVDTTSSALTVTLPASPSAGNIVAIADYAGTAETNNITIARNGSNIEGLAENGVININRESRTLVYVDATQGWVAVNNNSDSVIAPAFVTATGGTVTTCGDHKIHTFTGPGTFTVSCAGNPVGSNTVDYLVVAGGGGSGGFYSGGAGAGGLRYAASTYCNPAPAPSAGTALPVSAQAYPITVGSGGSAGTGSPTPGGVGNNSIFSTITSTGGGASGNTNNSNPLTAGGSGAGSSGGPGVAGPGTGGNGNSPPVSPPQGNNGGDGFTGPSNDNTAGGGGGAGAVGTNGASGDGGNGGNGLVVAINGSSTTYAGGGGGGAAQGSPNAGGSGGGGTGKAGVPPTPAIGDNGTANTGGGAGGNSDWGSSPGGGATGGSGIVIIRYKYQ